jgi:hypothetical protein
MIAFGEGGPDGASCEGEAGGVYRSTLGLTFGLMGANDNARSGCGEAMDASHVRVANILFGVFSIKCDILLSSCPTA